VLDILDPLQKNKRSQYQPTQTAFPTSAENAFNPPSPEAQKRKRQAAMNDLPLQ